MIRHRWLSRTAVGVGLLAVALLGAGAASRAGWADPTVRHTAIEGVILPITAVEFSDRTVKGWTGSFGNPCESSPDEDVWYFSARRPRQLVSVTLTFAVPGNDQPHVETIGDDGIAKGTASIRTPAGWTLVAATAEVTDPSPRPSPTASEAPEATAAPASTGPTDDAVGGLPEPAGFVLTGTCPAERIFAAAPPAVKPNGKSTPRTTPRTPRRTASATPTPAAAAIPASSAAAAGYAPEGRSSERLPTTGIDVVGMSTLGVSFVVGGLFLITVRRRRDKPLPRPEPSDWY